MHLDAEREDDLAPQTKKGKKRSNAGASEVVAEDADADDADAGPACLPTTAQVTYLSDKAQGREGCERIHSCARKSIPCVRIGSEGHALILGKGCDRHSCAAPQLASAHPSIVPLAIALPILALVSFIATPSEALPSTALAVVGVQLISTWRSQSRRQRRATAYSATRSSQSPRWVT